MAIGLESFLEFKQISLSEFGKDRSGKSITYITAMAFVFQ